MTRVLASPFSLLGSCSCSGSRGALPTARAVRPFAHARTRTLNVETPEVVADRIRRALEHVAPEQVILAPDCGMKYLPRDVAYGKLAAMVEAAKLLRREYAPT